MTQHFLLLFLISAFPDQHGLQSVLFVSKLEVFSEFFSACENAALAFGGEHVGATLPTGSQLLRPVKKFVGEFVQSLIGTSRI